MNDVVAWSGGFDSTFLIIHLIKQGMLSGKELTLVSFHHNLCNEPKNIREEKARKSILKYLQKNYGDKVKFNHVTINTQVDYNVSKVVDTCNSVGLSQPIIWLSQIIPLIPSDSNIYFGYISNDDSVGLIKNMQNIIDNACFIQHKHNINICTPLISIWDKTLIMHYLISHEPELVDLCTSCENDFEKDKCGMCKPCRHMKTTLCELYINGCEKAGELLNKWYGIELSYRYTCEDNKETEYEI